MAEKKVIIIGAGVAGLATGSYLRINGFETEILEMGHRAGGVAVSWERKGYTFDSATNWLPGSAPILNLHAILKELIDFNKLKIIDFDEFLRVETKDNKFLRVFTDAKKLREEMIRIAPEDKKVIDEFTEAVRRVCELPLPIEKAPELSTVLDLTKTLLWNLPLMFFFLKWSRISIADYAARFSNPDLQYMFRQIFPRHDYFSVFGLIMSLGWMNMRAAGYPLGGSAKFVKILEEKYRSLGGRIVFNARVIEIVVDNGLACGVRLENGEATGAEVVVSAADGYDTLFNMLDGKYLTKTIARNYERLKVFPSQLQVSLGIGRAFEGEAHTLILPFDEPMAIGSDRDVCNMKVRICNFDRSLAPEGKTSVVALIRTTDYGYWKDLRKNDLAKYKSEKDRVARIVIDTLEKRFGEIASRVEVYDVATPATYIRYTNAWKGSYQGWAPTPDIVGRSMRKTLPGVGNFYMAGQWVDPPGGLPRVMASGRKIAQIICKKHGKRFVPA